MIPVPLVARLVKWINVYVWELFLAATAAKQVMCHFTLMPCDFILHTAKQASIKFGLIGLRNQSKCMLSRKGRIGSPSGRIPKAWTRLIDMPRLDCPFTTLIKAWVHVHTYVMQYIQHMRTLNYYYESVILYTCVSVSYFQRNSNNPNRSVSSCTLHWDYKPACCIVVCSWVAELLKVYLLVTILMIIRFYHGKKLVRACKFNLKQDIVCSLCDFPMTLDPTLHVVTVPYVSCLTSCLYI